MERRGVSEDLSHGPLAEEDEREAEGFLWGQNSIEIKNTQPLLHIIATTTTYYTYTNTTTTLLIFRLVKDYRVEKVRPIVRVRLVCIANASSAALLLQREMGSARFLTNTGQSTGNS